MALAVGRGDRRRLTRHDGEDFAPSWSPGGDQVYFGSTRSGGWQIWSVSTADRNAEPVQVTRFGGRAAQMSDDALWYVKAEVPGLFGPMVTVSIPIENLTLRESIASVSVRFACRIAGYV